MHSIASSDETVLPKHSPKNCVWSDGAWDGNLRDIPPGGSEASCWPPMVFSSRLDRNEASVDLAVRRNPKDHVNRAFCNLAELFEVKSCPLW
ncbi:MAG: hypothetical protein JWP89_4170 [Schlesneria sp.]|nr:hypothetical protein [Schlesneria sp.]